MLTPIHLSNIHTNNPIVKDEPIQNKILSNIVSVKNTPLHISLTKEKENLLLIIKNHIITGSNINPLNGNAIFGHNDYQYCTEDVLEYFNSSVQPYKIDILNHILLEAKSVNRLEISSKTSDLERINDKLSYLSHMISKDIEIDKSRVKFLNLPIIERWNSYVCLNHHKIDLFKYVKTKGLQADSLSDFVKKLIIKNASSRYDTDEIHNFMVSSNIINCSNITEAKNIIASLSLDKTLKHINT